MYLKLTNHPAAVLIALVIGTMLGLFAPEFSIHLAFVGDIYIDFVKMIAIPFMASAILLGLQAMVRESQSSSIAGRTISVFLIATLLAAMVAFCAWLIPSDIGNSSVDRAEKLGALVGSSAIGNDTVVDLINTPPPKQLDVMQVFRDNLIPTNIFSSLAAGETLKVLVFFLLFGIAFGQAEKLKPANLDSGLKSIYAACQYFNDWLKYPLMFVLICMMASQLAKTGLEPLKIMLGFVLQIVLVTFIALVFSLIVVWQRSGQTFAVAVNALRNPLVMALATRSSSSCMPVMIEALAKDLSFHRSRVELLVPLSVSLVRLGPIIFYVCATLFVASLYERTLSFQECLVVVGVSVMVSMASVGLTGVATIALISIILGFLGLPFEAAFVLFIAIDPISDMCRTAMLVVGNCAVVACISDKPQVGENALPSDQRLTDTSPSTASNRVGGAA